MTALLFAAAALACMLAAGLSLAWFQQTGLTLVSTISSAFQGGKGAKEFDRVRVRRGAGVRRDCGSGLSRSPLRSSSQYWYAGLSAGQTIIDLHEDAVPIAGNPPSTLNRGRQ